MEDTNNKRDRLKAVVLLLIGFIVGFASHAFTVNKESTTTDTANNTAVTEETGTTTPTVNATNALPQENTPTQMVDVSKTPETTGEPVSLATSPVMQNTATGKYTFSVSDQAAGDTVEVSQTSFEKKAWLAIREDMNGEMGNVLGAYLYQQGVQSGPVELLRATKPASLYHAVVYIDDGDMVFDLKKDALLTDDQGKVVEVNFKTF